MNNDNDCLNDDFKEHQNDFQLLDKKIYALWKRKVTDTIQQNKVESCYVLFDVLRLNETSTEATTTHSDDRPVLRLVHFSLNAFYSLFR